MRYRILEYTDEQGKKVFFVESAETVWTKVWLFIFWPKPVWIKDLSDDDAPQYPNTPIRYSSMDAAILRVRKLQSLQPVIHEIK